MLTPLRAATFYRISQLGMLAGTAVYINAGTQLGQLTASSRRPCSSLSPRSVSFH